MMYDILQRVDDVRYVTGADDVLYITGAGDV